MLQSARHPVYDGPYRPAVLLFRGRGFISAAIRWQTRSPYSHAALLLPNGRIVESWQGAGVRIKKPTDWADIDIYDVRGATRTQWGTALQYALAQVGQPYDYRSVARFLSRRDALPAEVTGRWFCSELVYAALQAAGISLLDRVTAAEVSPAMLALSPLLTLRSANLPPEKP